jgi:hypothetical protein
MVSARSLRMAAKASSLFGSPDTGTDTNARFPAALTCTVLGPKARSVASVRWSPTMACWTGRVLTGPSTTICAGWVRPPEKSLASTVNACLDWTSLG